MTERRADDATRDVEAWLKCEYMSDKVGEEFDGLVTGVTGFGLFVELLDTGIEGLIHVTSLENDYYHFDEAAHQLVGERSGHSYRLTDPIRVRVFRVDLNERKIDFEPVLGTRSSTKRRAKNLGGSPATRSSAKRGSKNEKRTRSSGRSTKRKPRTRKR